MQSAFEIQGDRLVVQVSGFVAPAAIEQLFHEISGDPGFRCSLRQIWLFDRVDCEGLASASIAALAAAEASTPTQTRPKSRTGGRRASRVRALPNVPSAGRAGSRGDRCVQDSRGSRALVERHRPEHRLTLGTWQSERTGLNVGLTEVVTQTGEAARQARITGSRVSPPHRRFQPPPAGCPCKRRSCRYRAAKHCCQPTTSLRRAR